MFFHIYNKYFSFLDFSMSESMAPVNSNMQDYDTQFLNSFLKNKRSTYDFLTSVLGLYLPSITSKAVTEEYLLKVLKKSVVTINRASINPAPEVRKKITTQELLEEIGKLTLGKDLGFDLYNMPDKEYLLNILFSLKKDHPLFTIKEESSKLSLDEE